MSTAVDLWHGEMKRHEHSRTDAERKPRNETSQRHRLNSTSSSLILHFASGFARTKMAHVTNGHIETSPFHCFSLVEPSDAWDKVSSQLQIQQARNSMSAALLERANKIVATLLSSEALVPYASYEEGEDEVSLFWIVNGVRAEISIPEAGRIYVHIDSFTGFPELEGFFDYLPSVAIRERITNLSRFADARNQRSYQAS